MPDIDLTKDYNLLGQRVSIGGCYSDFYQYPFGLPYRSIVYEEGFVPLYFDTIKYIREHNTEHPGELPTTSKTYHIYAKPDLQSVIGSDPIFAISYEPVPSTDPQVFKIGFKCRDWQSGDSDYGHWNASGSFIYHYFNDGYAGVNPENVTGEDHWRNAFWFLYFSNIDGYGLPQDTKDRYGIMLAHYEGSVEYAGAPYVYDGYTFPAVNEYGVPAPELDPSYPGEHRVFQYGSFFAYTIDGNATAIFSRGIYTLFMGQFEEVPEDSPGDFFDLDDDETPPYPEAGDYDPNGYDGQNDINYPLPTKSVLTSGLFQLFIPNPAELQAFARYIWSSDYEQSLERFGLKPMDNIVNFGIIPFDLNQEKGSSVELELCGQTTGLYLTSAQRAYSFHDLGTIYIDPNKLSQSYLDYNDTNLNLYLPCLGFVKIRACEVVGRSVNITYRIDIATGDFIAYVAVIKNNTSYIMYSHTGNCMYKLPLTSADFASYYQRERQAITSMFSSGASAIGSALAGSALGGPVGAIAGGILSGAQSVNSIWDCVEGAKMNQPEVQRGGSFSGALAYLGYKTPFIVIDSPQPYRKGFYESFGYPTMRLMQLKDCKGLTQVARVNLDGVNATIEEKNMIRALLKDGVYIKSAT